MKIYKLILLLLFLTNISNSLGLQFLNLHVYSDDQCTKEALYGLGYSVAIDTCTTLDQINSFKFTFGSDGKTLEFGRFHFFSNYEKCSVPVGEKQSLVINSCIPYQQLILDSTISVNAKPYYYKISISSNVASVQANTLSNNYMRDNCDPNNIILSEYYINGTYSTYNSQSNLIYYCIDKDPYYIRCLNSTCYPPKKFLSICHETAPFYNFTSSDTMSSSGGSSGKTIYDTGSGTGYSGYSSDSNTINTGSSYSGSGSAQSGSSQSGNSYDVYLNQKEEEDSSSTIFYFQLTCL